MNGGSLWRLWGSYEKNHWYKISDQSLSEYAQLVGYNLALYNSYPLNVQEQLKIDSIDKAIKSIRSEFNENEDIDIGSVKKGIYVISLSNPLEIKYEQGGSQIIYIGIGSILGRVKQHFHFSLFDFMQSWSGANFDFHFAFPSLEGEDNYHKHIEYLMLEDFAKNFGGQTGKKKYPILNSNAGSNKSIKHGASWWRKPLKNAGKSKVRWSIEPTRYSKFAPLKG